MTEKQSGVICGYQETENGPITWRRELPLHCLLSRYAAFSLCDICIATNLLFSGLRPLITKLLAGLLESKQSLLWTYERYFTEVSKILSKVMVKFYILGESKFRTVYLDRTAE